MKKEFLEIVAVNYDCSKSCLRGKRTPPSSIQQLSELQKSRTLSVLQMAAAVAKVSLFNFEGVGVPVLTAKPERIIPVNVLIDLGESPRGLITFYVKSTKTVAEFLAELEEMFSVQLELNKRVDSGLTFGKFAESPASQSPLPLKLKVTGYIIKVKTEVVSNPSSSTKTTMSFVEIPNSLFTWRDLKRNFERQFPSLICAQKGIAANQAAVTFDWSRLGEDNETVVDSVIKSMEKGEPSSPTQTKVH